MADVREVIRGELAQVEEQRGVRILFATESGSRLWGFASKDSDYDVRFVYAKTTDEYLSLENRPDTIEWMLDEKLDIVGWDLRKFLRLMRNSNPTTFEWLGSPEPYLELPPFQRVRDVAPECFDPTTHTLHYISMAKKQDVRYIRNVKPTPKHYLYAVRATLAARWTHQRQQPVPMLFTDLVDEMPETDIRTIVDGLVVDKLCGVEKEECERIPRLDSWLESNIDELQRLTEGAEKRPQCPFEKLDDTFIRVIKETEAWDTQSDT